MKKWKWRDVNYLIRLLDILTYFYVIVSFPLSLTSLNQSIPRESLSTQDRHPLRSHPHAQQHNVGTLQKFLTQPFSARSKQLSGNWKVSLHLFLEAPLSLSLSLANLIIDNEIRNSNWAIIRSSIMWHLRLIPGEKKTRQENRQKGGRQASFNDWTIACTKCRLNLRNVHHQNGLLNIIKEMWW
jgi:hypothetical protein